MPGQQVNDPHDNIVPNQRVGISYNITVFFSRSPSAFSLSTLSSLLFPDDTMTGSLMMFLMFGLAAIFISFSIPIIYSIGIGYFFLIFAVATLAAQVS